MTMVFHLLWWLSVVASLVLLCLVIVEGNSSILLTHRSESLQQSRRRCGSGSSSISPSLAQPTNKSTRRRRKNHHREQQPLSTQSRQYLKSSASLKSKLLFVQQVNRGGAGSSATASATITRTLIRGALLRITSDLSGATVFESIKTRVTTKREGPIEACRNIIREGGIFALWTGTQSRMVEGGCVGAVFMLGSTMTKRQLLYLGASPAVAALAGGLVGGIAQAFIVTPAGMIFTSLNYNRNRPGYENDNAITALSRIVSERGVMGMYYGFTPMAIRQASNWASRATITEVVRTRFQLKARYGMAGELLSGIFGGLGSCWNTPVETARLMMQRDLSSTKKSSQETPPKSMFSYWNDILIEDGPKGFFRGITPRAMQSIWQTTFLVVVPNILGV